KSASRQPHEHVLLPAASDAHHPGTYVLLRETIVATNICSRQGGAGSGPCSSGAGSSDAIALPAAAYAATARGRRRLGTDPGTVPAHACATWAYTAGCL